MLPAPLPRHLSQRKLSSEIFFKYLSLYYNSPIELTIHKGLDIQSLLLLYFNQSLCNVQVIVIYKWVWKNKQIVNWGTEGSRFPGILKLKVHQNAKEKVEVILGTGILVPRDACSLTHAIFQGFK